MRADFVEDVKQNLACRVYLQKLTVVEFCDRGKLVDELQRYVQPGSHVVSVDDIGWLATLEHLRSDVEELITAKLWDRANLLHGQADELHRLDFLARAEIPQVVSILYLNLNKLGHSCKLWCQNGVSRVLDAFDHVVDICCDVHAESAGTLFLVIDGLKTKFLHAIGRMNNKPELVVQASVIHFEILINQRYDLNFT